MASRRRPIKRRHLALLLLAAVLATVPSALRAQAPDEPWRTIETEHFRVHFPEDLETLARRAGDRAEWAWDRLSDAFIEPPDRKVDVLVTDHTDRSNGFAQVTPGPRMTIFARPPADALSLSYSDEWLELVVLHELAHVVHLDHVLNPIGRLSRSIFGRVTMEWPFFPGLGTPRWLTEGIATWYESRLTQAGRVEGTFEEMQLRAAILEDRFEDIGQASGNSPLWPAGNRPYAYGSLFFDFLLERHGEERMAAFVDAVAAQWVPYRLDAAGRDAFGVSLSDEWKAWRSELEREAEGLDARLARFGPLTDPERVTRGARWGLHPAVSADGTSLVYNRSDGRSDTHLRLRALERGTERDLGRMNSLGPASWLPDGRLLVSQLELDGPYRQYSDLWIFDAAGGERRVTEGARLTQPAAAPDGGAWAIREGGGTSTIVRVDLDDGTVTELVEPSLDVHWAYPRPSPDGRWLAAARWLPNGYMDIVVLDPETGRVVTEVTTDRALDTTPTWSPDGDWLVWASDRTGILNLYAARVVASTGSVSDRRMLTNLRTGGAYPDVGGTGAWLYYSGYHAEGWDVERVPFDPSAAPEAPPVAARFSERRAFPDRGMVDEPVQDYDPGPTLRPHYWEIAYRAPVTVPVVQGPDGPLPSRELLGAGIGLQTSGRDIAGRHAWGLTSRFTTTGRKLEVGGAYSFAGFGNPLVSLAANQRYDGGGQLLAGMAPDTDTLLVLERRRDLGGSVTFLAPTWRYNLSLSLGAGLAWEARALWGLDLERSTEYRLNRPTSRLGEASVTLAFNSSRSHAFQLGTARGLNLFLQARAERELALADSLSGRAGVDRSLGELVGRARGAVPLWGGGRAAHVLAVQLVGGAAGGPGADAFHYRVGGASGQPETVTGLELFGGSFQLFPVRGYLRNARVGRFAWSATAEYRFPIAFVNRGLRAWPVHLDRIAGAFFFDAGNAWGPDVGPGGVANPVRDPLASVGAEITTEFLGRYDIQLRVRAGGAFRLVGGTGARAYVRAGLPF